LGTAAANAALTIPKNAATSHQYDGIKILILWGFGRRARCQGWLTFRQAFALGGHVR
jgi:antirestriction protein ArdC